jgi:hypothetical protein
MDKEDISSPIEWSGSAARVAQRNVLAVTRCYAAYRLRRNPLSSFVGLVKFPRIKLVAELTARAGGVTMLLMMLVA